MTFLRLCADAGIIAGAVIAAVVVCVLIAGLLYYLFSVKGHKPGGFTLRTQSASTTARSGEQVGRGRL